MIKKITGFIASIAIGLTFLPINVSATSGSLSISCPASGAPGSTVKCNVTFSASYTSYFEVKTGATNGSVSFSGDSIIGGESTSATKELQVKLGSSGTTDVTVSGSGSFTGGPIEVIGTEYNISAKTAKISIVTPSTSGGSSGGSSGGNSNTDSQTETDKKTNQKTPEQIAAEKLAERKRSPLISKVEIVDLNQTDKVYGTIDTKTDVFEYAYQVPKNVSAVKLNYTKIADSVTITGPDTVEFSENEFEKSVTLSVVQDEVAQEIKVKVSRPVVASTTQSVNGVETRIVDRDEADAFLKEYSFNREVYKDSNDLDSFVYTNGKVRLQLVKDPSNRAYWLLLDDKNEVVREVVPVFSETAKTVSFLWEAPEETQNQKHQNESYQPHTFEVSETMQAIDESLTFNMTVGVWKTENVTIENAPVDPSTEGEPTASVQMNEESDSLNETETLTDENTPIVGFIAYGLDSFGNEGFKYIDQVSNTSMAAFASFDIVDNFHRTWAYVATGVALTVTVGFVAYFIIERRKFKQLIEKHNSVNITL